MYRCIDTSIFTPAHFNCWVVKTALENRIVRTSVDKSHLWKHFGFFSSEDGAPVKDKMVCRLCWSEVSYCKNITNLCVHLERHHRSEYALLLKAEGEKDKFAEKSQPTLQKVLEWVNPLPKDSKQWQTLVEAIGNFIVWDMQPLSVVDNAGFKQLMYTASLVSRFHLYLTLLTL